VTKHRTPWEFGHLEVSFTDDYPARGNAFTGTVKWVQLDLGDDDHSHLIPPEHHLQIAMTRQQAPCSTQSGTRC
jgi:hypothetical protein